MLLCIAVIALKSFDNVELLREADDSHKCTEYKDGWGMTPRLLAADSARHGASVSAVAHDGMNLLDIIATNGRSGSALRTSHRRRVKFS